MNRAPGLLLFPEGNSEVVAREAAWPAQVSLSEEQLRSQPEYGVAYELEMWKQAEMAKWSAQMRSRELERMSLLEGEWRRREKLRDAYDAHLTLPICKAPVRLPG